MHKENAALAKVRPLLTKLCGDHTWANCEMFLGSNDAEYFDNRYMSRILKRKRGEFQAGEVDELPMPKINGGGIAQELVNGKPSRATNGVVSDHKEGKTSSEDVAMTDGDAKIIERQPERETLAGNSDAATAPQTAENESVPTDKDNHGTMNGDQAEAAGSEQTNGDSQDQRETRQKGKGPETRAEPGTDIVMVDDSPKPSNNPTQSDPHIQPNDNEAASLLASLMGESFIHPMFLAPKSAHPERDLGLPEQEAEDVRRLLQLYVQKQEEVCRGARRLYEGLLKADRLRQTVLAWSKAEAHCGPNRDMSDGEDWYDKEEWGLTEDLKKGQDEEEEDTTQTQKKTRNRNK